MPLAEVAKETISGDMTVFKAWMIRREHPCVDLG